MLDCAAVCAELLAVDELLVARLESLALIRKEDLIRTLPFVVACHDLGKFSRGFQSLRLDIAQHLRPGFAAAAYSARHDVAGYLLWRDSVLPRLVERGKIGARTAEEELTDRTDVDDLLLPWFRASCGHHGQPPLSQVSVRELFGADDIDAANGLVYDLVELFGPVSFRTSHAGALETLLASSAWVVAGLVVLCDWVGSNTRWFCYRPSCAPIADYYAQARVNARRALQETGLLPAGVASGLSFKSLFSFAPSPLQQFVDGLRPAADSMPELLVIEDVTGAGKTEAALTIAAKLMEAGKGDGIYFALPTMATSDQMYERLANVYGRFFAPGSDPTLIRTHSGTRLHAAMTRGATDAQETAEVHRNAWLSDGRKKAFLVKIGVGTIDQALLSVLPSRHNVLRLLGLHRKVLIVDEIHSYDSYVGKLIETLLEFHAALGGSAVLLTATLSLDARRAFCRAFAKGAGTPLTGDDRAAAFPLVTHLVHGAMTSAPVEAAPQSRRRVEVDWIDDEAGARDLAVREARAGKAVCWIRNSVDDACEAAVGLALDTNDLAGRIDLFHARFAFAHRQRIENRVLRRFGKESDAAIRAGRIVVATQVIEQSLDLDFDVMISDLAPIDLVIQRCGRLQRHARDEQGNRWQGPDRRGTPRVVMLAPPFDVAPTAAWVSSSMIRTAYVYEDHSQLWRTMKTLRERGAIVTPDECRLLIESVFGADAEVPLGLARSAERVDGARRAEKSLALLNALRPEQGYRSDGSSWLDDHSAVTRLGEPTVMLRLVVMREDGGLEPLISEAECEDLGIDLRSIDRWSLGDVTVRRAKLSGSAMPVEPARIDAAKTTMADLGKWCEVLPLWRRGASFEGIGWRNAPEQRCRVTYHAERGLMVEEG